MQEIDDKINERKFSKGIDWTKNSIYCNNDVVLLFTEKFDVMREAWGGWKWINKCEENSRRNKKRLLWLLGDDLQTVMLTFVGLHSFEVKRFCISHGMEFSNIQKNNLAQMLGRTIKLFQAPEYYEYELFWLYVKRWLTSKYAKYIMLKFTSKPFNPQYFM